MKRLVAGAAGQVECRLVRQLLERNHDMRKAKSWIGFQPRGDLRTMIKSALLFDLKLANMMATRGTELLTHRNGVKQNNFALQFHMRQD